VIVSQSERAIDVWTRSDEGVWVERVSRDAEIAELSSIGARLPVREVYDAIVELK
jgi:hypothetical protein